MVKHKYIYLLCLLPLLTGCWDSINIEDRGFIVGTSIDVKEMQDNNPIYEITDQLVLPESFGTESQGGNDDKSYLNLSDEGSSIYKVNEELPAISSKAPYFEHLKVLIISEELAREKQQINKLLDRYLRDVSLRRGIKIIIAGDKADRLLDLENPEDRLPAIHLNQMLERGSAHTGFLKPLTLGDIEEYHLRNRSYILPYMTIEDVEAKHRSGAVFHGAEKKMVGLFNADEMLGIELYKGEATGNVIDFTFKDNIFTFNIKTIKSKQRVDDSSPLDIKVKVEVTLHGIIKETTGNEDILENKKLKEIESSISKEAQKHMEQTIKKAQKDYHTDVFKVWQKLQTKHYNTWKQVRDNWEKGEDYFSNNVTFEVDVDTKIYSIGTSDKTY